jgi:hypothetical protein
MNRWNVPGTAFRRNGPERLERFSRTRCHVTVFRNIVPGTRFLSLPRGEESGTEGRNGAPPEPVGVCK